MKLRPFAWMFLPLLGGCFLFHTSPFGLGAERVSDWYETGAVRKPLPDITATIKELLTRQGYTLPDFKPAAKEITTGWDTHMSPMWREGCRSMIEVEILTVETGGYNVRVRSTLEINEDTSSSMNPDKAHWIGAGASDKHKPKIPEAAMKLQATLKIRFFGLNQ